MPTYYKPGTRKGNRFYVVRGSIDGREHEIATHCRDKSGAEDHWSEFKRQVRAQRAGVPAPGNATWLDASALYRHNRPGLAKNDLYYLRRLDAWFGATPVADIDEPDVHAAAHGLYPACLPQTKNRQALAPAAAVLRAASKKKWCQRPDIGKFSPVDPDRPVTMPEQAETAIAAARSAGDTELAVAIETLAYQGWRISELLGIERARIDWSAGTLRRRVSKSGKWRTSAIDWEIMDLWKSLTPRDDGLLFRWRNRYAFYKSVDALGLPFHYRPHQSRRGFATALKNTGADQADIAEASQWEDTRSVGVYVADDIKRQRATLVRLRNKRLKTRNAG